MARGIHPDHVGVRKCLRNRRGGDAGAAPDVDNGRPGPEAFGHGVDRVQNDRDEIGLLPACAHRSLEVTGLGPVFVPGHADAAGERLDRAVDLVLGDGRPEDTRLIVRMIGLGQHHGGLGRQHELAVVMLSEVE